MINSWDVFDTIVGRWYGYPTSIFEEMEKALHFENFAKLRHEAEMELYPTQNKVILSDIYLNLAQKTGMDSTRTHEIMNMELEYELKMSFPIMQNVRKVQEGDIFVSDMYLSPDFIYELLEKNGIPGKHEVYVSSGGKISGWIWKEILQEHQVAVHTGDNPKADCESPQHHGIRCGFYSERPVYAENLLREKGFSRLASLARVLRLSNPYPDGANMEVWNEQASLNVPILILLSLFVPKVYSGKRVLMTARDCNNLQRIFPLINPNITVEEFLTSRQCYRTASPSFKEYALQKLGDDDPLLLDLHGIGKTADEFFGELGKIPKMFLMVQSDLNDLPWRSYMFHRSFPQLWSGQSPFHWEIENANLDVVGSVMDVNHGVPLRAPLRYLPHLVEIQHQVVDKGVYLLEQGFDVGKPEDFSQGKILEVAQLLLAQMHQQGAAVTKYGIPDINDWPNP